MARIKIPCLPKCLRHAGRLTAFGMTNGSIVISIPMHSNRREILCRLFKISRLPTSRDPRNDSHRLKSNLRKSRSFTQRAVQHTPPSISTVSGDNRTKKPITKSCHSRIFRSLNPACERNPERRDNLYQIPVIPECSYRESRTELHICSWPMQFTFWIPSKNVRG